MSDLLVRGYALSWKRVFTFAAAFVLWVLGIILERLGTFSFTGGFGRFLPLVPFLCSWLMAGLPVLRNAAGNLLAKKGLDENFLMSVATIGAFVIGEWAEAAAVMLFYMIGEIIQEAAIGKSRSSINALLALKPDKARILKTRGSEDSMDGGTWKEVGASQVDPGSIVMVRPGERIPLDGIIINGKGSIDTSMLTGESRPVICAPGDEVRSGTISLDVMLQIRTIRSAGESSAARIIQLVENAREAKAKPERFITVFARWYTPLVVGSAVLLAILPPVFLNGAVLTEWIYRALILLVISCPCALVVSVPLGYFAGIGGMSRRGIMVKGAAHLDSLNKAKIVAFDKTGTLTKGEFSVVSLEPAPGISKESLLETAALAETQSNHPIARAIAGYSGAPEQSGQFTVHEIAGQGIEVASKDRVILAGNRGLMESRGIIGLGEMNLTEKNSVDSGEGAYTPVYVSRDKTFLGRILIGDSVKEGAVEAVNQLKDMGIGSVMLTGDTRSSALETASRLGITQVEAELLPEDKLGEVEKLLSLGTTVFVGDGINDAPVLARSHVGIAMGSGADAAVEAADVIIMTSDPRRVPEAIQRARKTHRIVMGNVAFALGAKGIFLVLAGLGLANMWIALIADVGVALAAILNSSRALGTGPTAHKSSDPDQAHGFPLVSKL